MPAWTPSKPTALRAARIALGSLVAGALALAAAPAYAAMPATASVEGLLLSTGGGPAADGTYPVTFAIYTAPSGGTPVWSEGPVSVAAKNGQMSYLLGSKTPLTGAVLNLSSAYLSMQIGNDPELGRQSLGASLYAIRASVAESLDCSGCVKAAMIDAAVLQPYAKTTDLAPYAKTADLAPYAKTASLAPVATSGKYSDLSGGPDLSPYAKTSDLSAYVQASSLAKVAGTGSYTDLANTPTFAKVATSGSYSDLTNKPAIPAVNSLCGTGLYMKGFNADGSINCQKLVEGDMPGDGIDEVSNGLIFNQFTDSTAGTADVAIKDGLVAGVSDTLNFPDIGLAQKISVTFTATNSDISKLVIDLYGPGLSTPYSLYAGGKTGSVLNATFNDTDALVKGDLTGDWHGKNIAGPWSSVVKDTLLNQGGGADGKFNWAINIQTLSNKKIEVKGDLIVDGNVSFKKDASIGGLITSTAPEVKVNTSKYTVMMSMRDGINCPTGWTQEPVSGLIGDDNYVFVNLLTSGFWMGGMQSKAYGQMYNYMGFNYTNMNQGAAVMCYKTYDVPTGNAHISVFMPSANAGANSCPSGYTWVPVAKLRGNNNNAYFISNRAGTYMGYIDTWDYAAQAYNEFGGWQRRSVTTEATDVCFKVYGTTDEPATQSGVFPVVFGVMDISKCPTGWNAKAVTAMQSSNGYTYNVVTDNSSYFGGMGGWGYGGDNFAQTYYHSSHVTAMCWKYFNRVAKPYLTVRTLKTGNCASGFVSMPMDTLKGWNNNGYIQMTGHSLYVGGLYSWDHVDYSDGYIAHNWSTYMGAGKLCLKIDNVTNFP